MLLRDARRRVGSQFSGRTIDFPDGGRFSSHPPFMPAIKFWRSRITRTSAWSSTSWDGREPLRSAAAASSSCCWCRPRKRPICRCSTSSRPRRRHRLRPVSARPDLPYLDLTPDFQARAREGERLFFEVDGHPNAAGYRLIAEVVLDHLRSTAQASSCAGLRLSHLPGNGDSGGLASRSRAAICAALQNLAWWSTRRLFHRSVRFGHHREVALHTSACNRLKSRHLV